MVEWGSILFALLSREWAVGCLPILLLKFYWALEKLGKFLAA